MKALEQEGAITFMIYLFKRNKVNISTALKDLEIGQSALYTTLRKLLQANLIAEVKEDRFPFSRFFVLTDKGRKVAEHLVEVEKILKETP